MIAFLTTTDSIKLTAAEALLLDAGITTTVFDRASGMLWTSIILMRLMIAIEDILSARRAMAATNWVAAADGDWDCVAI